MCGVCGTRGVDAEPADLMGEKNLYQNVKMVTAFAEKSGAVVAATGKNDIVSDGRKAYWIQNGHSMMQTVTGVGYSSQRWLRRMWLRIRSIHWRR